jgi:hypothetical protein
MILGILVGDRYFGTVVKNRMASVLGVCSGIARYPGVDLHPIPSGFDYPFRFSSRIGGNPSGN